MSNKDQDDGPGDSENRHEDNKGRRESPSKETIKPNISVSINNSKNTDAKQSPKVLDDVPLVEWSNESGVNFKSENKESAGKTPSNETSESTESRKEHDKKHKSQPLIKGILSSYFENPWDTWNLQMVKTTVKMSWYKVAQAPRMPPAAELDLTLPVISRDKEALRLEFEDRCEGVKFMWIGHASCLVKLDGVTFLADPMFSDRCSPSAYVGPKRYRDPPCKIGDLPNVDAVIISHNHYDHLDKASVKQLNNRFRSLKWLVPQNMKSWIVTNCGRQADVTELKWWAETEVKQVRFVLTPSQHWCGRMPIIDYNKVLWGSWCVIGRSHKFFFAGDTGYCTAFKEIGDEFGPFDLAAIPIGAYYPRDVLKSQHVDSEEAVRIHKDIKCKESIGIHWGTFVLTYEPILEPKEKIEAIMKEEKDAGHFYTIHHGDIIESGKKQ